VQLTSEFGPGFPTLQSIWLFCPLQLTVTFGGNVIPNNFLRTDGKPDPLQVNFLPCNEQFTDPFDVTVVIVPFVGSFAVHVN
jgi:hypothetical protein